MAQDPRTYATERDGWLRLLPALIANAEDIPYLEVPRLRLELITTEAGDLLTQQAALSASKQDVSKRLQALIAEGRLRKQGSLRAEASPPYFTKVVLNRG